MNPFTAHGTLFNRRWGGPQSRSERDRVDRASAGVRTPLPTSRSDSLDWCNKIISQCWTRYSPLARTYISVLLKRAPETRFNICQFFELTGKQLRWAYLLTTSAIHFYKQHVSIRRRRFLLHLQHDSYMISVHACVHTVQSSDPGEQVAYYYAVACSKAGSLSVLSKQLKCPDSRLLTPASVV